MSERPSQHESNLPPTTEEAIRQKLEKITSRMDAPLSRFKKSMENLAVDRLADTDWMIYSWLVYMKPKDGLSLAENLVGPTSTGSPKYSSGRWEQTFEESAEVDTFQEVELERDFNRYRLYLGHNLAWRTEEGDIKEISARSRIYPRETKDWFDDNGKRLRPDYIYLESGNDEVGYLQRFLPAGSILPPRAVKGETDKPVNKTVSEAVGQAFEIANRSANLKLIIEDFSEEGLTEKIRNININQLENNDADEKADNPPRQGAKLWRVIEVDKPEEKIINKVLVWWNGKKVYVEQVDEELESLSDNLTTHDAKSFQEATEKYRDVLESLEIEGGFVDEVPESDDDNLRSFHVPETSKDELELEKLITREVDKLRIPLEETSEPLPEKLLRERVKSLTENMKAPLAPFVETMQTIGNTALNEAGLDWKLNSWVLHTSHRTHDRFKGDLHEVILKDTETSIDQVRINKIVTEAAGVDSFEDFHLKNSDRHYNLYLGVNLKWDTKEGGREIGVYSCSKLTREVESNGTPQLVVVRPPYDFDIFMLPGIHPKKDDFYEDAPREITRQSVVESVVSAFYKANEGQGDWTVLRPRVIDEKTWQPPYDIVPAEKREKNRESKEEISTNKEVGTSKKEVKASETPSDIDQSEVEPSDIQTPEPSAAYSQSDIDYTKDTLQEMMTAEKAKTAKRELNNMFDHFGVRGVDGLLDHFDIPRHEGLDGLFRKAGMGETNIGNIRNLLNSVNPTIPGAERTIPGTPIPMGPLDELLLAGRIDGAKRNLRELSSRLGVSSKDPYD